MTSNESSFGVIESTTRTIKHVKDIFPHNPSLQSQMGTDTVTASSSSSDIGHRHDQDELNKSDSEEIPLLPDNNSNDK
jgi:hypothetical protein